MSTTVYISGPMTGYVNYNREAFHRAAAHLSAKGYTVVNPAAEDEKMHPADEATMTHADYLRRDIVLLLDCDLIYTLPGWRHSKGATLEMAVARGCGIDRLKDADIETWRTFEGEPEPGPIFAHAQNCDVEKGDGYGNEWCVHGEQVAFADAPEPGPVEQAQIFGDIDLIVDPLLDANTLRIESDFGHVDFEVSWDEGEMTLARKAAEAEGLDRPAESYQPGDSFPNVGYVRQMTGLPAEHLTRRRLSTMEVAEAVNAHYVASADGRGAE